MREPAKEFIKTLRSAGSYHSEREAFDAFLELSYCALAKTDPAADQERRDALEARYMHEVGRWKPEAVREVFPKLLGLTMTSIIGGDFLGVVASETGALNAALGQFFTPYDLCRLMAKMTCDYAPDHPAIREKGFISMLEPASGSGAMILAHAEAARDAGLDVSTQLFVEAIDVSPAAFKACYIQLACAGVPAKVIHGNALTTERFEVAFTPVMGHFHHANRNRLTPAARQRLAIKNVRKRVRA